MVKHSETLASKFLASLRVPPFVDTQVHMAGKVFNHSRPTIFLRSFAHFSGQKVGTRLVVPLLGALVFLIFLFGFGICLGCRSLGFRISKFPERYFCPLKFAKGTLKPERYILTQRRRERRGSQRVFLGFFIWVWNLFRV